jgi:uncharacterized membrane protein YczE
MVARAFGRLLAAHPLVGAGVALLVRSDLGAAPWDVFHVGLAGATGMTVGAATMVTAALALGVALAAGVRPGVGTLVNVVVLGVCVDGALAVVPTGPPLALAALYLAGGILLIGLGTGLYLSAHMGSGPRDSLMVALERRCGLSTRRARVVLELGALGAGLLLGGRAGAGTLIYAAAIGPVAQLGIQLFMEEHP